ncbi:MAG: hypothetical protein QM708_00065 [Propioniciclava sp.]|uniref:hypothetical protein n=1 Tax=Propioniciclava sp. TaxID=2038686 RepID=UPI0039E5C248
MDEIAREEAPKGPSRRTVVTAAAWAAPVIAVAAAAPMAAASQEPEEAMSIGATTTSPRVGNIGVVRPFGLDANGQDGAFPPGQTFTLTASFDFLASVVSWANGTITPNGPGSWLITPNEGVTNVNITFRSSVAGTYELTSNGPIDPGQTWGGAVL